MRKLLLLVALLAASFTSVADDFLKVTHFGGDRPAETAGYNSEFGTTIDFVNGIRTKLGLVVDGDAYIGGVLLVQNGTITQEGLPDDAEFHTVTVTGAGLGGGIGVIVDNGLADGAEIEMRSDGAESWRFDNYNGILRYHRDGSEWWEMLTTGQPRFRFLDGSGARFVQAQGGGGSPGALTATMAIPLIVGNGGTGATTFTSNGVLYGAGSGAVQATAQGAANSVLVANAGAPSFTDTPVVARMSVGASSFLADERLRVSYGITDPTGAVVAQENWARPSLTAANSQNMTASFAQARLNGGTFNYTGTAFGVRGVARFEAGSGTASNMLGVSGLAQNTSTGTITLGSAVRAENNLNSGGGTIALSVGFDALNQSVGTSNRGIWLRQSTSGTNNFALFQDNATVKSYFAAPVGFGTTAPSNLVTVGDGSSVRGVARLNKGSGTTANPAELILESTNGTAWFFGVSDAGDLYRSSSSRTSDTAGTVIGGSGADIDGLFGTQIGSTLHTTPTCTSSIGSVQVGGAGAGVAVSISTSTTEVIVEYELATDGDGGSANAFLATTNSSGTPVNGITALSGTVIGATLVGFSNVKPDSSGAYQQYRTHILCTRISAGTYYVNLFFQNDGGGGSETCLKNLKIFTN